MKYANALAAVAALRECDHLLLSETQMHDFNEAFDVVIQPQEYRDTRHQPKGLTLYEGKTAMGMDAATYAEWVVDKVGSPFKPWQSGRGFRLRSACDAIEQVIVAAGPLPLQE